MSVIAMSATGERDLQCIVCVYKSSKTEASRIFAVTKICPKLDSVYGSKDPGFSFYFICFCWNFEISKNQTN